MYTYRHQRASHSSIVLEVTTLSYHAAGLLVIRVLVVLYLHVDGVKLSTHTATASVLITDQPSHLE
jgi:hypothetical protein